MTKHIFFLTLLLLLGVSASSQIKKPKLGNTNANTAQLNQGIKVPNIKNLTTADLSKLKLPVLSITEKQRNSKPLTSWKITPNRLKDTYLELYDFFGYVTRNGWEIHSMPMIEGREVTRWNGGFLSLKFRQSQQTEYRMKIKLKSGNYRGKQIYVMMNDFSARYPIDPNDGTVNIAWTANRTSFNSQILIGQMMKTTGNQDQRKPFPITKIEYVQIDKISN